LISVVAQVCASFISAGVVLLVRPTVQLMFGSLMDALLLMFALVQLQCTKLSYFLLGFKIIVA